MNILYIKALHIIFVVTWFAGLFYIPRFFINYTEANEQEEPARSILQKQFGLMMSRLWFGITWPSAILATTFGYWLVAEMYGWQFFQQSWLVLKLAFVLLLWIYHFANHAIHHQIQNNILKYSSFKLRIWNELASVFLVAIVFIVVLKDTLSFIWGIVGLFIFIAILLVAIRAYKKMRGEKNT